MSTTAERYTRVRAQLDETCVAAGRAPEEVVLVAVSKTVDLPAVQEAINAGCVDFGENRPDELVRKATAFPQARWHFIGNIQSRRIPEIVQHATLIHSVCKFSHLVKINLTAQRLNKIQYVMLEVNVSGEASKSGFTPAQVYGAIAEAQNLANIRIVGLMTMAPQGNDQAIHSTFAGLQELRNATQAKLLEEGAEVDLSALSMGMSEDWPVAVAYGTTIVRVGRAIFSSDFS